MTHVVIQYQSTESLFNVNAISELNSFIGNIEKNWKYLFEGATAASGVEGVNSTSFSIVKIISCLNNYSTNLDKADIERTRSLLASCALFFEDLRACYSKACSGAMDQKLCSKLPLGCQNPIIYHTFEYFLSSDMFSNNTLPISSIGADDHVYALIILPIKRLSSLNSGQLSPTRFNETSIESYLELEEKIISLSSQLKFAGVVALEMGLESELFQKSLILDARLLILGLILVSSIIWLYSSSLFYTIAVFFTLLYSVGIAYFVYRFVFRINFFPFMNLLVFALLIGIGADDTFVLYHVYYMYTKKGGVYGNSGVGTPRDLSNG
uniref:Uncharacterized protein n=1 Tax=Romanomermis culicivorax TaxID=13658 RepID=A0A915HVY5_ROMCU